MRFLIVTGMSGAGKATALHYFTDIGYYAVDNVPPRLLPALADSCCDGGQDRLLVVVDARVGRALADLPDTLKLLAARNTQAEVVFLDASDDVLVRRFKETRRPHPLFGGGKSVLEAIQAERVMLEDIRACADRIIDTTNFGPADLARALAQTTGEGVGPKLHITVESFGFKHGIPIDADLVFDVRFLANPHYVPSLKPLIGLDPEVARYVHNDPLTEPFLEKMFDLIGFTLPQYQQEGKAYLTIAIGCTGGRHRSVTVAEDLATYLRSQSYRVEVFHRDARRESYPKQVAADSDTASEDLP
jgi:UPF0042 nucleotide-binding protein